MATDHHFTYHKWFPWWRKMSSDKWRCLLRNAEPERQSPNNTFESQDQTVWKPHSPLGFSLIQSINISLADLIGVSVTIETILNEYSIHTNLFLKEREKFAPEPCIRVVIKTICLNARTCKGTRFKTRKIVIRVKKKKRHLHLKEILKSQRIQFSLEMLT